MEFIALGTGAAWPDGDRSAPAFLVIENDKKYLIDCGGGTSHQLMKAGFAPSSLKDIFITHIHIDHCVEFPSLVFGAYLTGKKDEFNVYGPEGVKHFTDSIFDSTYDFAKDMMKKLRNININIYTNEFDHGNVFDDSQICVKCLPVKHGIATLAYSFTAKGKKLVFSADTEPCDNIIEIAQNADALVIECSFPEESGPKNGHCIPSQVGRIASEAGAKKVYLTHLFPTCKGKENEMILDVQKYYSGSVEILDDLKRFIV